LTQLILPLISAALIEPTQRFMEKPVRSLVKSVSYRTFGFAATAGVAWMLTKDVGTSAAIGLADTMAKLFLFFLHERAWNNISFGKIQHPLAEIPVKAPLTPEHKAELRRKLDEMGYLGDGI
jgi:uncharacterized membrane protein